MGERSIVVGTDPEDLYNGIGSFGIYALPQESVEASWRMVLLEFILRKPDLSVEIAITSEKSELRD